MSENDPLRVNDPAYTDEILEEIWQIRREMWAEFNGDMEAMGRYLEEQQRLHPERVYAAPARGEEPGDSDSSPEAA